MKKNLNNRRQNSVDQLLRTIESYKQVVKNLSDSPEESDIKTCVALREKIQKHEQVITNTQRNLKAYA